jgi:hypothetical protein
MTFLAHGWDISFSDLYVNKTLTAKFALLMLVRGREARLLLSESIIFS